MSAAEEVRGRPSRMTIYRWVIGSVGVALGLYGVFRLTSQIAVGSLLSLLEWMIGAVVLHDLVLSPLVVGVGVALSHLPPRGRTYVQAALIAGGLVTVLGLFFVTYVDTDLFRSKIAGPGEVPREPVATRTAKSLLTQHYGAHLLALLAVIAGACVLLYVRRLLLDRRPDRRGDRADGTAA